MYQHRFLSSRHVRWLHFGAASLRATQRRLRRLWAHEYLDRAFVPVVVLGSGTDVPHTGGPLYCLAERGARVVSEHTGVAFGQIPSTPAQNRVGFATLCHHLVVTDWLVSLAACPTPAFRDARLVRESELRRRTRRHRGLLVPDGAAEIRVAARSAWVYLEVVRADPRGGRRTLAAKLERYVAQHHARRFRDGYGHEPLRRVLFVTPTAARRDRLVELALRLDRGRQLFAFASYGGTETASAPSAFSPETADAPLWITTSASGQRLSELLTDTHPHAQPSHPAPDA